MRLSRYAYPNPSLRFEPFRSRSLATVPQVSGIECPVDLRHSAPSQAPASSDMCGPRGHPIHSRFPDARHATLTCFGCRATKEGAHKHPPPESTLTPSSAPTKPHANSRKPPTPHRRLWPSRFRVSRPGVFPAATLRDCWGPLLPARDRTPSARGTPGCGDLNRRTQACQSRTSRARTSFIARESQFSAELHGTRLRLSAGLPDSSEFGGSTHAGGDSEN